MYGENETYRGLFTQVLLLKQQESSRFPDDPVKIKYAQVHSGDGQRW